MKLFISHASADEPVVREFVELLESGIGIPPLDIFCSSIKGQGIRLGAEFKTSIHENLDEASSVIALISENYYNSPFCMCELGGTWLQSKDFIPILLPPLQFKDLRAVLEGIQTLKINSTEDLDELRDELAKRLKIDPLPTPRWNKKRNRFFDLLPEKLESLPTSPIVHRIQLDKVEKELLEYREALDKSEVNIEKLNSTIKKLKSLKNAKEVTDLEQDEMEDNEVFKKLVRNIVTELSELYPISQELVLYYLRNENYFPDSLATNYDWDDAEIPKQYDEIAMNADENWIELCTDHPNVQKVLARPYPKRVS